MKEHEFIFEPLVSDSSDNNHTPTFIEFVYNSSLTEWKGKIYSKASKAYCSSEDNGIYCNRSNVGNMELFTIKKIY